MSKLSIYTPSDYGTKEEELQRDFQLELDDARRYFLSITKPRLDRAYKLYIAYTGDRQREIKSWQANIFVPYVQAVVETLMPRVLDARPEFSVVGRSPEDNIRAEKQRQLGDYTWELAGMDNTAEDFARATMIYGTGFLQVSWKKDVRKLKFLDSKNLSKELKWIEKERVFYDAPFCEWVDNYSLWYDWHNTDRKSKQYWFKRLVLTEGEIKRRYPGADKKRLALALASEGGDLVDYAAIRQQVRTTHDRIVKGASTNTILNNSTGSTDKYSSADQTSIKMYEVFEWIRPFKDQYAVLVGASQVPIFKNGVMPILYDFKETPFIEATYLKVPGEFEGYGIPLILENPQIMLNLIKNQRLDAATLSIHKMWVVNPLANVNKNELVTRPFGIIYSIDPNGVREIEFSDIKASAYKEEEMLKGDMRYTSGVDDFSMGVGGGLDGGGATAVRHLRESTLERVRLFVSHLGGAYADVLRYWIDMSRQLMTKKMTIRVIGEDGAALYPIIEPDDLMGMYDYKAAVLPSIAGQEDVEKKQSMDLFQLLSQIDPQASGISMRKLLSKTIDPWGWTLDSISDENAGMQPQAQDPAMMEAMQQGGMMPQDMSGMQQMMGAGAGMPPGEAPAASPSGMTVPDSMMGALAKLRSPGEVSPYEQASGPINLLEAQGPPPTPQGLPSASGGPGPARRVSKANPRGLNRSGRVNTNIPKGGNNASIESSLLNRAANIQR